MHMDMEEMAFTALPICEKVKGTDLVGRWQQKKKKISWQWLIEFFGLAEIILQIIVSLSEHTCKQLFPDGFESHHIL